MYIHTYIISVYIYIHCIHTRAFTRGDRYQQLPGINGFKRVLEISKIWCQTKKMCFLLQKNANNCVVGGFRHVLTVMTPTGMIYSRHHGCCPPFATGRIVCDDDLCLRQWLKITASLRHPETKQKPNGIHPHFLIHRCSSSKIREFIDVYWLVVDLPLWKIWVRQWGSDDIPYMTWKIIQPCLKPPTRYILPLFTIVNHY